jgi:uncharacterized protein (TIGR03000 family)
MMKQWLSAGVFALLLSPGVGSAQVYSPNVTGISAGANYNPYARNGGAYYFGRASYYSAPPYYGPRWSYYYTPLAVAPVPETDTRALVDVRVPADAEVLFEGDKTSQTGSNRAFLSPALEPGRTFTYDIRARWTGADGKPVEQTRQAKVQAGRRTLVDFLDGSPK